MKKNQTMTFVKAIYINFRAHNEFNLLSSCVNSDLFIAYSINTTEHSNGWSDPVTLEHKALGKPSLDTWLVPHALYLTHFTMLEKQPQQHKMPQSRCSAVLLLIIFPVSLL